MIFGFDEIHHGWNGENRIKPIFTEKSFFDDIHMEHAQESTSKS